MTGPQVCRLLFFDDPQVGKLGGPGIVVDLGRLDIGRAAFQVQLGHQIGISLVQIDGAGMHLVKSHGGLDGLQQRVVGGIDNGIVAPGGGADIDALGRIGDAGREIPFAAALAQQALLFHLSDFPLQGRRRNRSHHAR